MGGFVTLKINSQCSKFYPRPPQEGEDKGQGGAHGALLSFLSGWGVNTCSRKS